MSHEPTTQPLPPAAAHRSLQQLWLPLRQQQLHKMSQRNISPRGKLEIKPKPHFCVHPPLPPRSFLCDDGNKGIIRRLFHPSDVQCYTSVCWTASELSRNRCLVKSTENIFILRNTTHFTSAVASEPYFIFVLTMLFPFFGQPEWFFGHKSGSTC